VLASFLKSIGFIIPLMDAEHAFYYTREVMVVLKREFQTPDEEMKKIVLKVGAAAAPPAAPRGARRPHAAGSVAPAPRRARPAPAPLTAGPAPCARRRPSCPPPRS
jgi:hypothetical protein